MIRNGCLVAAMMMVGLGSTGFALADPTIEHGMIKTPTLRVLGIPIAPQVALRLAGDANDVYFDWDGPGNQILRQQFSGLLLSGEHVFQASGSEGTFSPYAAAGTWTLSLVTVCRFSACSEYEGASLAAVIPSLTVQVSNPKSDVAPPTIESATILTPSVATANTATVKLTLVLHDNLSGVFYLGVSFGSGGLNRSVDISGETTSPIIATKAFELVGYCGCARVPAGSYPVTVITLTDAALNTTTITDPATISSLFSGQATLTLTNRD